MTANPTPGFREGVEAAAQGVSADDVLRWLCRHPEMNETFNIVEKIVGHLERALPTPPAQPAGDVERVAEVEAGAKILAEWIGYSWDGLHERVISAEYKDWAFNGVGTLSMQGGRPALRKVAAAILRTANETAEGREREAIISHLFANLDSFSFEGAETLRRLLGLIAKGDHRLTPLPRNTAREIVTLLANTDPEDWLSKAEIHAALAEFRAALATPTGDGEPAKTIGESK